MYLAELHGKLSSRAERQEDVLTSDVFSFFKYADRKRFLRPFLEQKLSLSISDQDAEEAVFHFWPCFEDGTEPDLVLIVGNYYLLFEAKLYADFAPATKTARAQLERELEGGQREAQSYDKVFRLIALTRDHVDNRKKFASIPKDCFSWVNWQSIAFFIYECLQSADFSPLEKLFADDLYQLLDRRRLRNFAGWPHLAKIQILHELGASLFFNAQTAGYRGAFIGFGESLSVESTMSTLKAPLFFGGPLFQSFPTGLGHSPSSVFFKEAHS